jgi:carboxyl-terminal processing protease
VPIAICRRATAAAAVFILAASPLGAQTGPSTPPTAPALSAAAREYLTAALDTLQHASMHDTIDWAPIRDSAFLVAAGAEQPRDTYAAIQWALKRVDRHSFLQASRGQVNPELVGERFGYLRVPFYNGPSQAPLADSLQNALRTLEGAGACGWIVDLRMNGGGNVWPMQVGIAPLIGDSVITREAVKGRPAGYTVYADGAAIAVEPTGERATIVQVDDPYVMQRPDAAVAVLIDKGTASSAEAIAIAFRPRPATRFFGVPTAGYSTVNRGAQLPDGANMVITVGTMADRDGRAYGGPIEPDELIEVAEGSWPTSRDPVARGAAAWLAAQPGCADAPGR